MKSIPMLDSGLMQVYSQKTGRLQALLLDEGILTELRTAAVGALATQLLAPTTETIGIVGSGIQARYQLDMLTAVTDCRNVLVWGRTPSNVNTFVSEMSSEGWNLTVASAPDQLLRDADLIITTTPSRESILGNSSLETRKSGLTIICIGSDAPGKLELNPSLVAKADLLVADTVAQSVERGEYQKAVEDGLITKESLVPLGTLIRGENLHRKEDDNRFIIFDSSGVALQDCVVSSLVIE
jgi:ornithine cyclodeaminase